MSTETKLKETDIVNGKSGERKTNLRTLSSSACKTNSMLQTLFVQMIENFFFFERAEGIEYCDSEGYQLQPLIVTNRIGFIEFKRFSKS